MSTKEDIYDDQISPLMKQIIAVCKEHNIATVCTFSFGSEVDEDAGDAWGCTTALTTNEFDPHEKLVQCAAILQPPQSPVMHMTVEHEDGSKELHTFIGQ